MPNSAKPTISESSARDAEDLVAQQRQRQDRFARAALDQRRTRRAAARRRPPRATVWRRAPRPGRAAEARDEHDRAERRREHARAEVVDRRAGCAPSSSGSVAEITTSATSADRQVDVEDPAPGEVLDDHAAEQRPGDAREAEHRPEQALVAAALARGHDVADASPARARSDRPRRAPGPPGRRSARSSTGRARTAPSPPGTARRRFAARACARADRRACRTAA